MRKSEGWNEKKQHEQHILPRRNFDHLGICQKQEQHISNICANRPLCGIDDYKQSSVTKLEHNPTETLSGHSEKKTIRIDKSNWFVASIASSFRQICNREITRCSFAAWSRVMRLFLHGMHTSRGAVSAQCLMRDILWAWFDVWTKGNSADYFMCFEFATFSCADTGYPVSLFGTLVFLVEISFASCQCL